MTIENQVVEVSRRRESSPIASTLMHSNATRSGLRTDEDASAASVTRRRLRALVPIALFALCGSIQARATDDLSALDDRLAGPRTQVLVLGSVHLAESRQPIDATALAPVIDRLVAFKPNVVAVESISGEGCDLMARHPAIYGPLADNRFCARTATAGRRDVPATS
jgi:hypothetical protein